MAPCSTNYPPVHHIRFSEKDNIRLRKPAVEKMRRDRINTCIEQLKLILEKEFHQQEPNTKLEKADVLEMTVSFLRQQLQPGGAAQSRRESLHHLSACSTRGPPQLEKLEKPEQLHHHHQAQRDRGSTPVSSTTTTLHVCSTKGPVWRPW